MSRRLKIKNDFEIPKQEKQCSNVNIYFFVFFAFDYILHKWIIMSRNIQIVYSEKKNSRRLLSIREESTTQKYIIYKKEKIIINESDFYFSMSLHLAHKTLKTCSSSIFIYLTVCSFFRASKIYIYIWIRIKW